jgi:glycosyltransferase involved in cell wall biosynthesis
MFDDMQSGKYKGLIFHGSKTKKEVLEQMKKCCLLLYPNVYPETFCNVLMESRACRTPFITSYLGCLKETGENAGVFISGNARDDDYQERFFDTLEYLMTDINYYEHLITNCYPIRNYKHYSQDLNYLVNNMLK